MTSHNPNCDGSGTRCETVEVRTLPLAGDGNVILCRSCFRHEMAYRRERNLLLEDFAKFDLPAWESLKPYPKDA